MINEKFPDSAGIWGYVVMPAMKVETRNLGANFDGRQNHLVYEQVSRIVGATIQLL